MRHNNTPLRPEDHKAVIDATRSLLEAGSEKNIGTGFDSLKLLVFITLNWLINKLSCITTVTMYLQLTVELIELFLKHERVNVSLYMSWIIKAAVNYVVKSAWANGKYDESVDLPRDKRVMDGLGDMFRCFLVAKGGLMTTHINWKTFITAGKTLEIIVVIAGHSSKYKHSKKLINLMLDGMTGEQINQLRTRVLAFAERRKKLAGTKFESDKSIAWTNSALKFLSGIETPHSLQHLVRRSILQAVSGRSLPSAEELCLPLHVREYLVFA